MMPTTPSRAPAKEVANPHEGLTGRTTQAAKWRLATSVAGACAQFGTGVVLARLLRPADFGLMALALIVQGIAQGFGDLGVAGALVQRKHITARHVRAGFTFSVILGLTLAAVIAMAAPLAARVMAEPRITPLLRWLALSLAIQGPGVVGGALLRRDLDYKRRFLINTFSYLAGYACVTIVLADLGYGVWSLVWGGLAQALLYTIGILASTRVDPHPLLARSELYDLLNYGVGMSLGTWVNYLARNGDNFVIGRYIGAESLGLYNRAYSFMNLPFTQVASVMSSVLFPALSQLQHEPARLQRAYLMTTRLTAAVSAPAMGTMAIAAPHLIVSVYGAQWKGTVVPLQIFCAFGYFRALYHIGGIVAQSAGRVYAELRNQVIYAVLVIVAALIGIFVSIAAVATGVGLAIFIMFLITGRLALDATNTSWRVYMRQQTTPMMVGLVTCAVAWTTRVLFEAFGAASGAIALAVLVGGAVPGVLGLLWVLSEEEFRPLLTNLPRFVTRCVDQMYRFRASASDIGASAPSP
jgi:PST family polysaccharide transporter